MFKTVSLFFAVTLAVVMSSMVASAQCSQWRPPASGGFFMPQTNSVGISINQFKPAKGSRNAYTGVASYRLRDGTGDGGEADLTINGSDVQMRIYWYSKRVGIYNGKITATGRAEGTGYEQSSPSTIIKWFTYNDNFECVPTKPGSLGEIPGLLKGPSGTPVKPAPPKPKGNPNASIFSKPTVPGGAAIIASPKTMKVDESEKTGRTTITWDRGPKVSYAELWVQIDDEKEKYLEGSQTMNSKEFEIVPYRTYVFFLKASKQRIASVTVRFTR